MSDFTGAEIPDSDFADDDGTADVNLRAAMVRYNNERSIEAFRELRDALVGTRVLVPVVARVDSMEEGVEKDSHMASVNLVNSDGRVASLAFTGIDSLLAWNDDARPIPRNASIVAASAMQEDHDALILDISGPVTCVIDGPLLGQVAVGENREALLATSMENLVGQFSNDPKVVLASWQKNDDGIIIFVALDQSTPVDEQLNERFGEYIRTSQIAVLLDMPISIQAMAHEA